MDELIKTFGKEEAWKIMDANIRDLMFYLFETGITGEEAKIQIEALYIIRNAIEAKK